MNQKNERPFLVTSWNVLADDYIRPERYPRCTPDALAPSVRHGRILGRLEAVGPGIHCLQEVDRGISRKVGGRLFGDADVSWTKKSRGKTDGVATAVPKGLRRIETLDIAFDDAHLKDGPSGQAAQQVTVGGMDGSVTLFNVHLKWDHADRSPDLPYGILQAKRIIALATSKPNGVIIAGDFNAGPDSPILGLFRDAGFEDAHGWTDRPTFSMDGNVSRIDYLLYRGLVAEPVPIPDLTAGTILPSVEEPSDHVPISAWFSTVG